MPGAHVVSDGGLEARDQKGTATRWMGWYRWHELPRSRKENGLRMAVGSKADKYPPPGPETCRS